VYKYAISEEQVGNNDLCVLCQIGAIAAPVQGLLIWRCFKAMKRRWCVLIPLALLLLSAIGANIWSTLALFLPLKTPVVHGKSGMQFPVNFIVAYFLTAALDIIITGLMVWVLLGIKTNTATPHAKQVISHFLRIMWEAAVPPCLCAIAAGVIYVSTAESSWWSIFCQNILGMLYVLSLLATLNGREDIKRMPKPGLNQQPSTITLPSISSSTLDNEGFDEYSTTRAHLSLGTMRGEAGSCERARPGDRGAASSIPPSA